GHCSAGDLKHVLIAEALEHATMRCQNGNYDVFPVQLERQEIRNARVGPLVRFGSRGWPIGDEVRIASELQKLEFFRDKRFQNLRDHFANPVCGNWLQTNWAAGRGFTQRFRRWTPAERRKRSEGQCAAECPRKAE